MVAISPLPLGSNRPLGWSFLSLAIGILLVAWSLSLLSGRYKPAVTVRMIPLPAFLFLCTVVWIIFQSLSISPDWLHNDIWQRASSALGVELDGAISINQYSTMTSLMKLMAYAGIFWLSLQYSSDRVMAKHD